MKHDTDEPIELEATERTLKLKLKKGEVHKIYQESSKYKLFENFFTINQEVLLYCSRQKFSGTDFRILMVLLGTMEKYNSCKITQTGLVNYLKIPKQSVSRSLKKLKEKKLIIVEKNDFSEKENVVRMNMQFIINRDFAIKTSYKEEEYNKWHLGQAKKESPLGLT